MTSTRKTTSRPAPRTPPTPAGSRDSAMLDRLLFFTDAVFAIVLTLLVLELRPPDAHGVAELWAALGRMMDHFVAFALTFTVIGIFWVAHLNTLRVLKHFDWPVAVLNLIYLFPICLLPFVSGMTAEANFGPLAWTIYSVVLIAASVGNVALVLAIWRGRGRLVSGVPAGAGAYRVCRAAAPGIAFSLGLVALAFGQLNLSRFCWLLIPLIFLIAQLVLAPKPADF